MKTKHSVFVLIIILAGFVVWWLGQPADQVRQESNMIVTNQPNPILTPAQHKPPASAPAVTTVATPITGSNAADFIKQRVRQQMADLERGLDEWRTPIEFYGKVVDENEQPVEGAQIMFGTTDLSPAGTSDYPTVSGAQGLFSITGIQGKLLTVKISKEGYYTSRRHNDSFYYAGQNENFAPDAAHPVVFRLRKKGAAEPLVHFRNSFRVPKDGTPIHIDLATGKLCSPNNRALKVECWTKDTEKKSGWKYDWKCRVSVPGGGLQMYDEEFPFLAPGEGYIAANEIDMPVKPDVPWSKDVKRSYFVHTADGRFARVVFAMVAGGDHFSLVDCYFNPSGSRNLEPAN